MESGGEVVFAAGELAAEVGESLAVDLADAALGEAERLADLLHREALEVVELEHLALLVEEAAQDDAGGLVLLQLEDGVRVAAVHEGREARARARVVVALVGLAERVDRQARDVRLQPLVLL